MGSGTLRGRGAQAAWMAALVVVVGVAYLPALDNDFWSDDLHWLEGAIRSQHDRSLWISDGIFSNHFNPTVHVTMSFDLARGGGAPRAFMETNVAIHVMATVVVALLGAELLRSALAGLLAATFWATSALIAEPVLWTSARVHSLAALLELLALLSLLRAVDGGHRAWGAASVVSYLLALGAKETSVAMVVVLFAGALLDPRGRLRLRPGLASLLGALAATFTLYRMTRFQTPPMGASASRMVQKALFALDGLFLPGIRGLGETATGIGAALFLAMGAAALRRRDRGAILGALLVAVPLGVTLPRPYHSSRYDYVPLAGAVVLGTFAMRALLDHLPLERRSWTTTAIALLVLLVYVPSQLLAVRREERDYDALGRATRTMLDRYAPLLRALPCPSRIAFVDRSPDLVTPLAREILAGEGLPKLIQARARGVGRMVLPHVLLTVARIGMEPECACLSEAPPSPGPPDEIVVFGPGEATRLPQGSPVPPGSPSGSLRPLGP